MTPSLLVDQLATLRDRYPDAPLIVFVPRAQLGEALETALARRLNGWRGIRALIPRHYAESVVQIDVFESGRRQAPVEGRLFRAARLLKDQQAQNGPSEGRRDLPGWHLLASTVADAIESLRTGGVGADSLRQRAESADTSETLGIVADMYERYFDEMGREKLYDDGDIYRWATERVQAGDVPDVPNTVYAVAGTVDLPDRAFEFLKALQGRGCQFCRIGTGEGGPLAATAPRESAAARFGAVPIIQGEIGETAPDGNQERAEGGDEFDDRFIRAVGAGEEVRSVFRDILRRELPFEEVEIAYASERPYGPLIVDTASALASEIESGEEQDLSPLTMGTGVSAGQTRTGQAVRRFFEWAQEGFDPALLVGMLRGGLIRTDRWLRRLDLNPSRIEGAPFDHTAETVADRLQTASESDLPLHKAATMIASRSYESGREGLLKGLASAIEAKRKDLRHPSGDSESEESVPDWTENRLARWMLLYFLAQDLVDLIPREGTIQTFARSARTFLERFGPVDQTDKPEEERTLEESARNLLYDRIDRLSQLPVSCAGTAAEMTALFRRWLDRQVVAAQRPRPGHIHALPLESAGYSDRRFLYVVGLDSTTFSAPAPENGMLPETERQALTSSLSGPGAQEDNRSSADDQLWRAVQALRRHRGPTTYCTRTFDIEAGEERDPSSLFLQLEREASRRRPETENSDVSWAQVAGLIPDLEDQNGREGRASPVSLSDVEVWLAARKSSTGADRGDDSEPATSARSAVGEVYPWILQGESARQARASDVYTEHDGLLAAGSYPELHILGIGEDKPLSASRLETFAETPYIYFLKYVLGARPLDEPALDDEAWLNPLRKGSLLHEVYERYMRSLGGDARPSLSDRDRIREIASEVLDAEAEQFAPPSGFVKEAARRELESNAVLFLHSEAERGDQFEPIGFELGFGYPEHRRQEGDISRPAKLDVQGESLFLRGRIDRVDRNSQTSKLVLWDYKTGSTSSYDDENPLQDGKTLQWALYAQAIEDLIGEKVESSGYFFANLKEFGDRITFPPADHQTESEAILKRLAELAETGSFPVAKTLHEINRWKWNDYSRIFQDLSDRKDELKDKDYPERRPRPPGF